MYNLSYTQAVAMMEQGYKVKHKYFTNEEYFHMPVNNGGSMVDEAGYPMDNWYRGEEWQNEGWMVVEDINPDNKQMKVVIIGGDMSSLEDRVNAYFQNSIKEMCRGVEVYFKTPEVLVQKPGSFDFTQHKIKKGKGHNKLQKRKKK